MILAALIIFLIFLLIFGLMVFFDVRNAKKRQQKYHIRRAVVAFLLMAPAVVLAFFFIMLPILYSLGYAFTNLNSQKMWDIKFVGFKQFKDAFEEIKMGGKLASAIKNTAFFVVIVVPLQIGLALLLALFCNAKMWGSKIFKICFFAPVVVSLAVTSYLWLQILEGDETGMLNSLLLHFGMKEPINFLNDVTKPERTMFWIVIISAWQGCGYQMLIFLSALTGIRKDLYEAARMDGCNVFQRFWKVTLPGLRPTLLYVLITVFIGACRIMVQPMIMVGYHENGVTLSYYMWQEGLRNKLVGYTCAIALVMTVFIGTITFIQRKILGENKR